jgi:hypothetical protein
MLGSIAANFIGDPQAVTVALVLFVQHGFALNWVL